MDRIDIKCKDDRILAANWIRSAGAQPALASIVIHSATGVKQGFYQAFAEYLAEHNFDVLIWDARGIGESATLPAKKDTATMRDWGQLDQQAILQVIKDEHADRPIYIIGHSSGGHLTGLAPLTNQADALILIASGGCDWRDYPLSQIPRLLLIWFIGMPLVLSLYKYLPAKIGVGHALPLGVAKDWRRWSLTQGYLWGDTTLDTTGYKLYAGPVLGLSMSDDIQFSPPKCVQTLLNSFSRASVKHEEITADQGFNGEIGHFGFFKSKNASLWPRVTNWLLDLQS